MKYFFIILLFYSFKVEIISQSEGYEVESFQDTFVDLTDFTSLLLENWGDITWTNDFDLPFEFPFFDRNYDYITVDFESSAYFDDTDIVIDLLTFGYEADNVINPENLVSDVRYKYTSIDGVQVFVLEYTKNRLSNDLSVGQFDSFITFQIMFFENGNIELHFGDINLDNSPVYVPGDRFYLIPYNGDPPILWGPALGIFNPDDDSEGIYIDGPFDNYEITPTVGYLTVLPPKGWVIRFKKLPTNIIETQNKFSISPNPTQDKISIQCDEKINFIKIYSLDGKLVDQLERLEDNLNISDLSSGIYYIHLFTHSGVWKNKIIKI